MADAQHAEPPPAAQQEPVADPEDGDQPAAPLSKKAQKRAARAAARKELTARKKATKKAARKAETAKKREESRQYLEGLPEAEQARLREEARLRREKRAEEAAAQKRRVQDAMQGGQALVIDLDFEGKMSEKEVKSLCQQLSYCYSVNSRAEQPAHLHFASLSLGMRRTLERQAAGCSSWAATFAEQTYLDLFAGRRQDLVYLSADASDTLEALDPQKIYIIGGIVDRNRYKRLCQAKAEAQGIATARLPLEQHVKLDGTRVLTVNQVYAILVHWLACKDWGQAVQQAVPERKRAREQPAGEPEAGDSAGAEAEGELQEGAEEQSADGEAAAPVS